MDKTQKLILTLLILTLVFSVVSIVLNFFILNTDINLPARGETTGTGRAVSAFGSGQVQVIVERNPVSPGGNSGTP